MSARSLPIWSQAGVQVVERAVERRGDLRGGDSRAADRDLVVAEEPGAIRAAQPVFAATGGLHAVGLFTPDGALSLVREDVGRHNAVDKVIGAELRAGRTSLAGKVMLLSGRAGFELIQKAAIARVPIVCSVSAPSALAV